MKLLVGIFVLLIALSDLQAKEDYDNLAKELANLRENVDKLHSDIQDKKELIDSNNKSYARQKQEIESQINKETLRNKQLTSDIAKQKDENVKAKKVNRVLDPLIGKSLASLEVYIKSSMPFKQEERLQALKELKNGVEGGTISPEKAINRVWSFYEDEIRLTKENGIYKQPIDIEGTKSLCDVVKIGMMAMLFKTDDGKYGMVKKTKNQYITTVFQDSESEEKVKHIFGSFKKQIRVGYFELPNFISNGEAK